MKNIFLLFFGFSFAVLLLFNCRKYDIENKGEDFRVSFETNGGADYVSDRIVAYGERIKNMPATPKKPGFVFDGWYYRDSNFFDSTKRILQHTTLFAKWVMSPTVYLYADSRGGTLMPKQKLIENYEQSLPFKLYPEPIKEGYKFKGWFYDTLGKDTFNFHIPMSADDTMFAYWDKAKYHTLTFINYSNAQKRIEIDTVYENELGIPHSVSSNTTDSFFEAWYSHPTQGNVPFQFKKSLTKNDTVYARFFKPQSFILTFDPNYGVMPTPSQPFYFTGGLRITQQLPTPYFAGKEFAGWFFDNNTFKEKIDSSTLFYASTTAYAKWTELLLGMPSAFSYAPANASSVLGTPDSSVIPTIDAGVSAVTYSISGNPSGVSVNASTGKISWTNVVAVGTYNMTITATNSVGFTPTNYTLTISLPTYTVSFNLNYSGSTGTPANQTITSGFNASTPTAPTRGGYIFNGWFAATTVGSAVTTLGPITANTQYYAQWTATYTVSFNLNYTGSTGAPASQTITSGLNASIPTAPTRDGYIFNGWFVATTVGSAVTTLGPITVATTYYAQWTPVPCTEAYNRVLLNGVCYKTVVIGTQTWLAENLNNATIGISSCPNNSPDSCAKYGRLYDWAAAIDMNTQMVGWHLPSDAEWTTLSDYLGGESVAGGKMKVGGGSGFDALFAGGQSGDGGFFSASSFGYFWTATSDIFNNLLSRRVDVNGVILDKIGMDRSNRFSVRLIKD